MRQSDDTAPREWSVPSRIADAGLVAVVSMQDSQRKGGRKCLNLASFDRGSSTIERKCVMGANASHDGRISGSSVERRRTLCFGKAVTWLILPVVICLSQRLSHACLSISVLIRRNCEWLIKSVLVYLMVSYHLDTRGNSRANTCVDARLLRKGCIY